MYHFFFSVNLFYLFVFTIIVYKSFDWCKIKIIPFKNNVLLIIVYYVSKFLELIGSAVLLKEKKILLMHNKVNLAPWWWVIVYILILIHNATFYCTTICQYLKWTYGANPERTRILLFIYLLLVSFSRVERGPEPS